MTMTTTRILIVDDEAQMRYMLQASLGTSGYSVELAADGMEAVEKVASWQPDLILLDLGLPKLSGLDACRVIRAWSRVPIIVLSVRDAEHDKVAALDLGADDYLTKPFGIQELFARIRVALRHASQRDESEQAVLVFGELRIDMTQRQVALGGQAVKLTPTEYELLTLLARRAGSVLTNTQLIKAVWGDDPDSNIRTLRVFMAQLRRKIGDDPTRPRFIATETGVGYRFIGGV